MSKPESERILNFAEQNRRKPTKYEQMLWQRLKRGYRGVNFEQQIVIQGYIVDFYCHDAKLAIELDGRGHDTHRDAQRDKRISTSGVLVMRFPNPCNYQAVSAILFRVWPECRHRIRRGLRYKSKNPLRSQPPQGSIRSIVSREEAGVRLEPVDAKICGKPNSD